MSRTLPDFRGQRALVSLAAGALTLTAVAGCGTSRIAQTATQQPTIVGINGNAGSLLIRNAYIVPPPGPTDTYAKGTNAPIVLRLVNDSTHNDQLVSVTTGGADGVALVGGSSITAAPPSATASPLASASSSSSASPSAATSTSPSAAPSPSANSSGSTKVRVPVQTLITLGTSGRHLELQGLHQDLRAGDQVLITFTFAQAGQTTLRVPVATPESPEPHPSVTPTVGPGEPQTD